jgi:hypothetical protein
MPPIDWNDLALFPEADEINRLLAEAESYDREHGQEPLPEEITAILEEITLLEDTHVHR